MAEILRAQIQDDIDATLAARLRLAVRGAPLFAAAPALHMATPDRRAREIKRLAAEDYPEGTPERVARELLRRFAPALRVISDVERDFAFFGALGEALKQVGSQRHISRALVDQCLEAWRRVAQVLPPTERQGPWLEKLGERGALLRGVIAGYQAHLKAHGLHDGEDACWLAARFIPQWQGFAPGLLVVEDLDRVTPARKAMIAAAMARAKSSLIILRGEDGQWSFIDAPSRALVELAGGASETRPQHAQPRPLGPVIRAFTEESRIDAPPALQVLRPATRAGEVREVARCIKRLHAGGALLARMAVVFPSEHAYAELIEDEFAAAGIPYDSPFEQPLSESPPVAALIELLRVARAGIDRLALIDALRSPWLPFGDRRESPLPALEEATRNAGIVGGANVKRDWLEVLHAQPGNSQKRDREWLAAVLGALEPLTAGRMPALRFFDAVLNLLNTSGARRVADTDAKSTRDAATAMRVEALFAFARLCSQMRAQFAAQGAPALQTGELIRALTEQAAARSIRPPETGGERVRVLGLRELRGARFEHVFVIGLTDEDLPLSQPESMFFTPHRATALAESLGAEAAMELCEPVNAPAQADYLYAWALAAGDNLMLSLPAAEGDKPFVAATPHARLLQCLGMAADKLPAGDDAVPASPQALAAQLARGLCAVEAGANAAHAAELEGAALAGLQGRCIELARGDAGSPPGEFEGLSGPLPELARYGLHGEGRHKFSPSQVDSYAECPHRFWSRYVLGVRLPQEPTLDTPANTIGLVLHEAFERFVLLLRERAGEGGIVAPADRGALSLLDVAGSEPTAMALGGELIARAFDAACASHNARGPFWVGLQRVIRSGLPGEGAALGKGVLAQFIEEEIKRNKQGFGVRFAEFNFGLGKEASAERPDTLESTISIPVGDGDIALQGSVDRVDEGPQGLEIIDYKTGKARTTAEIRDGEAFQLPLYLAAVSRATGAQPAGMAYLRVPVEEEVERKDVVRGTPESIPAFDVGDLVNTKLPQRLARLSNAIQQGVFVHTPFAPLSKACAWCDFRVSCAVRDGVQDERQGRMADEDQDEIEHVYLPDRGTL